METRYSKIHEDKMNNSKRLKEKHIKKINTIAEEIKQVLEGKEDITYEYTYKLLKILKSYKKLTCVEHEIIRLDTLIAYLENIFSLIASDSMTDGIYTEEPSSENSNIDNKKDKNGKNEEGTQVNTMNEISHENHSILIDNLTEKNKDTIGISQNKNDQIMDISKKDKNGKNEEGTQVNNFNTISYEDHRIPIDNLTENNMDTIEISEDMLEINLPQNKKDQIMNISSDSQETFCSEIESNNTSANKKNGLIIDINEINTEFGNIDISTNSENLRQKIFSNNLEIRSENQLVSISSVNENVSETLKNENENTSENISLAVENNISGPIICVSEIQEKNVPHNFIASENNTSIQNFGINCNKTRQRGNVSCNSSKNQKKKTLIHVEKKILAKSTNKIKQISKSNKHIQTKQFNYSPDDFSSYSEQFLSESKNAGREQKNKTPIKNNCGITNSRKVKLINDSPSNGIEKNSIISQDNIPATYNLNYIEQNRSRESSLVYSNYFPSNIYKNLPQNDKTDTAKQKSTLFNDTNIISNEKTININEMQIDDQMPKSATNTISKNNTATTFFEDINNQKNPKEPALPNFKVNPNESILVNIDNYKKTVIQKLLDLKKSHENVTPEVFFKSNEQKPPFKSLFQKRNVDNNKSTNLKQKNKKKLQSKCFNNYQDVQKFLDENKTENLNNTGQIDPLSLMAEWSFETDYSTDN